MIKYQRRPELDHWDLQSLFLAGWGSSKVDFRPVLEHSFTWIAAFSDEELIGFVNARSAMRVMLDRARSDPAVKKVLASVRPDNEPSLNLVAQFGFERWVSRLTTRTASNGCLASMSGSDALAPVNTRVVVQTSD